MLSRAAGNFTILQQLSTETFTAVRSHFYLQLIHVSPAPSTLTLLINPNPAHNPNQLQRDGHWHTSERRPRARHGAPKDAWQERSRARGARVSGMARGEWRDSAKWCLGYFYHFKAEMGLLPF